MRRVLLAPVFAMVLACPEPEPCPDEQCRDWCERNVSVEETLDDPRELAISPVLSGIEYRLLEQRLFTFRRGPTLRGEQGYGVCEGTDRCERFVGKMVFESLPAGDYVVRAVFDVPEDGSWTASYERTCKAPSPDDLQRFEAFGEPVRREVELIHTPGGEGTEVVLDRFSSPMDHSENVACATTLQASGEGRPQLSADFLVIGRSALLQGGDVDR